MLERYALENGWTLSEEEFLPESEWHFGGRMPTWRMTAAKHGGEAIVYERSGFSSRAKLLTRLYGAMRSVDAGIVRSPSAVRRKVGRRTWHLIRRETMAGTWCWCGQVVHGGEKGEWAEVTGCRRCPKRWDKEYAELLRPILEADNADRAEWGEQSGDPEAPETRDDVAAMNRSTRDADVGGGGDMDTDGRGDEQDGN
ncbi:MAG TPA: hypothetical protein VNW68_05490 [Candidatus Limnocylindria bacterium]|nr:hypothetical protein [Candidatus Limnocylindria bacterium]